MKCMQGSILFILTLACLVPRHLFAGTFSEIEAKIKDYERLNPGLRQLTKNLRKLEQ
jgi:hypothetical protein